MYFFMCTNTICTQSWTREREEEGGTDEGQGGRKREGGRGRTDDEERVEERAARCGELDEREGGMEEGGRGGKGERVG